MKLNFFIFFLLIFSCNSNNSIPIDELSSPCDCLNEKIKVYKKIDKIYINNFDSINNNKIDIENNPLSEITKSNKIDGNQIKISEKIIEIDLPEVKKEIVINNKNNNLSKDVSFIDALNGLIVLILICMIAMNLSDKFKKF